MRAFRFLGPIVLAGAVSLLLWTAEAAAQGQTSEPNAGTTAVLSRGDGPSGGFLLVPSSFTDFRLSLRILVARWYLWARQATRAQTPAVPADVVSRKRSLWN